MSYQRLSRYAPNYTPAAASQAVYKRPRTFEAIFIHWWNDPAAEPSFEGVVATLSNPNVKASAHYVAESGRVCSMVPEKDIAWTTNSANPYSISIECNPNARDGDYNTIAELIKEIRARHGNLPLRLHKEIVSTRCQPAYDLNRLDKLSSEENTMSNKYIKVTKITTKKIAPIGDVLPIWEFNKYSHANMVLMATKEKPMTVVAIAHNTRVGSSYYMTSYNYNGGDIRHYHGVNTADAEEYSAPVPEAPMAEVSCANDDAKGFETLNETLTKTNGLLTRLLTSILKFFRIKE